MNIKSLLCLCLGLISITCHATVTNWQSFELKNGHILIPSRVEGVDGYALIDSGAQMNMINKSFIVKHDLDLDYGRAINVKGVHGTDRMPSINNVDVNLFGVDFNLNRMVSSSLGHHSTQIILGSPFLDNFIIQIDYPNQQLRFVTRDSLDLKKFQNIKAQADTISGLPLIEIGLNGDESAWVLLDTGNSGALYLRRIIASSNGWLEQFPLTQATSTGVVESSTVDIFNLPLLKIGPYELENILVSVPADNSGFNLTNETAAETGTRVKRNKRVDGILGYDVLQHFVLTLDSKKGRAHFGLPQ